MGYFLKNKIFMAAVLLTAAGSYGFAVTHESIGVDDTLVKLYLDQGLEAYMGRWTIYLLNKLFRVDNFMPFVTELGGYCSFWQVFSCFVSCLRGFLEMESGFWDMPFFPVFLFRILLSARYGFIIIIMVWIWGISFSPSRFSYLWRALYIPAKSV